MKQVNGMWRLGTIAAVGVAAAAVVLAVGRGTGGAGGAVPGSPVPVTDRVALTGFDSCDTALTQLRDAARPHVGPYGFGQGPVPIAERSGESTVAPAPAAPSARGQDTTAAPEHSGTTVNQAGVDEPDLVKTDGRRIVSVVDGTVRVLDAAGHKLVGSARLPDGPATNLLLDGDHALVFVGGEVAGDGTAGASLVLLDVTDGARVLGTLRLTGSYVDARQTGHVARVVLRSTPRLKFVTPDDRRTEDGARQENLSALENSTIDDWLPRYSLTAPGADRNGRLVDCAAVSHPSGYSGASMLTVLSIDLTAPLGTGDPVSVVADGDTVYGSGPNLYVADDHHLAPVARGGFAPQQGNTVIHQFDVSRPGRPAYLASGTVPGTLLNQYSLSEYQGTLRVATTSAPMSDCCMAAVPEGAPVPQPMAAAGDNSVTTVQRRGGTLQQLGRIDGLGVGERIKAVRFVGARGYVVTFKQTDPLYTIDLSDPRNPRRAGELQLTGYSAYLHDAGGGMLIGVGASATGTGRRTGVQVAVFDVRDAAAPKRVAGYTVPDGYSEVESDPHAFLYWPKTGAVVVPVAASEPDGSGGGVLVLHLAGRTLTRTGAVAQPEPGAVVRRSLVIGDELWTLSDRGMQVSALNGLTRRAVIPFG